MKQLTITAKIWLSIGIFVLGFILSTVLVEVQGMSERVLAQLPGWHHHRDRHKIPADSVWAETPF
jgi:hypothetical protein